jgi:type IV pilus assembly protein PilA
MCRERREAGFTLVELMVVVMILSILMAIAIPTFLGMRERAQDDAAKASVRITLTNAKSLMTTEETYLLVTGVSLGSAEPSLTFVDEATPSTGHTVVSQYVPDRLTTARTFVASSYSQAGKCFFVRDVTTTGTEYGILDPSTTAQCTADNQGTVAFGPRW